MYRPATAVVVLGAVMTGMMVYKSLRYRREVQNTGSCKCIKTVKCGSSCCGNAVVSDALAEVVAEAAVIDRSGDNNGIRSVDQ